MVESDRGHVIRAGRRGKRIRALAKDKQFIDLITKAKSFFKLGMGSKNFMRVRVDLSVGFASSSRAESGVASSSGV